MPHDVADLGLAEQGRRRADYAAAAMPVLGALAERFAAERPLAGLRLAACMHVTAETAVLARTLLAGGASLALAASNPLSTQDDVAAALVEQGVDVHARHGADRATYAAHLRAAVRTPPDLVLDDACDLLGLLHEEQPHLLEAVRGATEETTTGVVRLRRLQADGALRVPVVAVGGTPVQRLVGDRHGTGQSVVDAVIRATGVLLAGSTVVVAGYGSCGSGVAARARGLGARVVVTEVDPVRALAAVLDGHEVLPMAGAAPLADVVVTATGVPAVVGAGVLPLLRDGVVLVNAGHFDVEVDVAALAAAALEVHRRVRPHVDAYLLPDGRRLLLVAEGRVANLAAAEGHPPAVMDVSFAVQALAVEHLVRQPLPPGLHDVPPALDAEVARLRLAATGRSLDALTPEQERYLSAWHG